MEIENNHANYQKAAEADGLINVHELKFQEESSSETTSDSSSDASIKKREKWTRTIDFLLACIGFSVGLGNVWRFPYLCYKNGGGAFLIPYCIAVVVAGVPMFFLEVSLGQYMSLGALGVWNICPLFKGIGIASMIILFLLNIYYNVILAWGFRFMFASFTTELPWSHCNNAWNTENCYKPGHGLENSTYNETISDIKHAVNISGNVSETISNSKDPATEYWEYKVLQISTGVDDMGTIRWDLALCLLLAWIVVYFCIWKGIKSSGKVMYFTATSPYLLMLILLIRGATLPGAVDGIRFYIIPEWSKLADLQVWVDAGTQIFYTYSISVGTLCALGSYNKFNHNCWRDCLVFAGINSGTSLLAGFVIFSVLGFMAHEQGMDVSKVAESGPGLAFVAYPKAVAEMPIAPLWSGLFFFMLILLGLDSQFVAVEGFITAIVDEFPTYLRRGHRREMFVGLVCLVSMLVGLCMVANGGMYVFQLFDYYSGSRIILVVAFFECAALAWVYGVDKYYKNISLMLGFNLNMYMKVCWIAITPVFTLVLFAMCIYTSKELTYNRTYEYPWWAIGIGWLMSCSSVIMIPFTMIVKVFREEGTMFQRIKNLTRPRQLSPHTMHTGKDDRELVQVVDGADSRLMGTETDGLSN